jgi:hypothetical protein
MPLSPPLSPPADGHGPSIQTLHAAQNAVSAVSLPPPQAPLTQVWPAPDAPGLQRALEAAAPPVAAAPTSPATGAGPAAATPGGAAPGGGGTQDLDDLAHRLYPKIRPYLKQELWLDRERAGSLTGLS